MENVKEVLKILMKQQKVSMLGSFKKKPSWQILISTILSARANDKATIPVCEELFEKYDTLEKLANADIEHVKRIIKRTVYYNNKAKYIINTAKILLKDYDGRVPKEHEELLKLPGVGNKVAACVLVYGFGIASIPVDTHVLVISQRLGWTKEENPDKVMKELMEKIPEKYWNLVNELLVVHGQNICFKRNPLCSSCSIEKYCKYDKKNL